MALSQISLRELVIITQLTSAQHSMSDRQITKWVFTHNNWNQAHYDGYLALDTKYIVIGKEVGATGTPHLQGFFILVRSQRLSFLQNWFQGIGHGHFEPARGTNDQAANYCKKDGDFFERGTYPPGPGARVDIQAAIDELVAFQAMVGHPLSTPEIIRQNPVFALKWNRLSSIVRALFVPPPPSDVLVFSPWQENLREILDSSVAGDRVVRFIVDATGGAGKSFFQYQYFLTRPDAVQLLTSGKSSDIAHCIVPGKACYLFNIPRGGIEYLSYQILEGLKDRQIFSPKYNSSVKTWHGESPHVVVFTNEMPDMNKMSYDRYLVDEVEAEH